MAKKVPVFKITAKGAFGKFNINSDKIKVERTK